VGVQVITRGKALADTATHHFQGRRHLMLIVTNMAERITAPGKELRIGLNITDQREHLPGGMAHKGTAFNLLGHNPLLLHKALRITDKPTVRDGFHPGRTMAGKAHRTDYAPVGRGQPRPL